MGTEPKNKAIWRSIAAIHMLDTKNMTMTLLLPLGGKNPEYLCLASAHSLFHTNSLVRNLIIVKNTFYNCSRLNIEIIVETPFDIYKYKVSYYLQ